MDACLAIRARGITKCFGDVVALDGVDLDVAQGQIHGLVGPDGAGKTTLLGLMLGLAAADSGRLEILGTPVGRALAAADGVGGFVGGPRLVAATAATGSGIEQDKVQRSVATAFAHLYRMQTKQLGRPDVTETQLKATATCNKGGGKVAAQGPGNDWRCVVSWHLPGVEAAGT